ncbi:hypothetical protein [Taibaiella koreensis]|uniref:hypothetical protein n=1 Tax=Taibaiella koreensis TaxID=1268548 RepID=UPI000E599BE7|nr:hypothetical protein [Taibaiella koreensis]
MKVLFVSLLVLISFSAASILPTATTSVKRHNKVHFQGTSTRAELIKAIQDIEPTLSFKQGTDINQLPHYFANQEGKFSVALIGTGQSVKTVKFIIIIDNNKNQGRHLDLVERIAERLSGLPAKAWLHKYAAQLSAIPAKDFQSVWTEGTYGSKLGFLSKNRLLTVEFTKK